MNALTILLTAHATPTDEPGGHDPQENQAPATCWLIPGAALRNDGKHLATLCPGMTYLLRCDAGRWLFCEQAETPHLHLVDEVTGEPLASLPTPGGSRAILDPAVTYELAVVNGQGMLTAREPATHG